jgi:hypothetical protein
MYIDLILGLVREVEKEDEEEEGVDMRKKYKVYISYCVRAKEVGRGGLVSRSWNN